MSVKPKPRQRGAVLIVSLIMLAVMSLFVVSMLRTSIIELLSLIHISEPTRPY